MVLLSLFHKNIKIIRGLSSSLLISLASTSVSQAEVLAFFNPDYSHSKSYTTSLQSFTANDPVSLEALFNDWEGDFHPKKGTNLALESSRFDIGVVLENNYYVGYTYRHDVFVAASHDLTVLNHLTKNKLDLPMGKEFDLSLSLDGLEAHGIVLGKEFTFIPHDEGLLSISLAASLLYVPNTQQGVLSGTATALSHNDYDFYAKSDYFYTHNYLYDLDVDDSYGLGFSSHLTLTYQYKDFSMLFIANDIFGKIYWDNLPYSYIEMSSDNKYYDENGYVHYNPTVWGLEKQDNFVQEIPLKLHLQANYLMVENYTLGVGLQYMHDTSLPFAKFSYTPNDDELYYVSYESSFGSTTIGVSYHNISLALSADKIIDPSAVGIQIDAFLNF